ncbi:MAG: CBS domain-containing protein [Gaiellales bacterium]
MKVKDAMTTELVSATPETTLKDAARVLVEHRISGLPVVDAEGIIVGVISEADIVAKEVDDTPRGSVLQRFLEGPPVDDRFYARTVGEAMSSPALTITADRQLAQAASTMLAEGVNRLPVVDATGRLVGLVTRGDLVRAFTRDDETIRREISQLIHDLWLDTAPVEIDVEQGRVTVRGEVENEADARVLRTMIRRVPGVIDVNAELLVPQT